MTENELDVVAFAADHFSRLNIRIACGHCDVSLDFVEALIQEGIFEPDTVDLEEWHLSQLQYYELRRAARLHNDLGVNAAGIALAFDLLQQLEAGLNQ